MSGFVFAHGMCLACKQPFAFNPHKVPSSSALTGEREPICLPCYQRISTKRVALGLPPFPDPLPGAYDPMPEEEL